jgi:hypothetical protein
VHAAQSSVSDAIPCKAIERHRIPRMRSSDNSELNAQSQRIAKEELRVPENWDLRYPICDLTLLQPSDDRRKIAATKRDVIDRALARPTLVGLHEVQHWLILRVEPIAVGREGWSPARPQANHFAVELLQSRDVLCAGADVHVVDSLDRHEDARG